MPIDSGNLALKGLDDLFSTEENRQEEQREQVQQIPIDALHPFTNHPFKVLDDEAMTRMVESIAQYGVLAPLIARPRPEGGYEIISGHRRKHAAELAHLDTVPVIVRNMKDDAATILMVDSNLQREHILPSERAFAYKMKLDAIKNQGARSDLTSRQVVGKLEAADEVGKATDESGRQVQRFIRLTNLVPELLDMVDEKKISFNPAVELSYLDAKQQQDFLEAMDASQNAPSLSQAIRIKKLAQQGEFDYDAIYDIMNEEKKSELDTVTIKNETLRKYFPRNYTPRQMENIIIKLLDQWQLKKQQAKQRSRKKRVERRLNQETRWGLFCLQNLEVTPMNNTIPFHSATHAPQITVDVNILTMLKQAASCLSEAAGKDVYLAAIGPDMELTIIMEEDAPSVLPCFDEDDALISVKGAPLFISYNPAQVLKLAGKRYLAGPVIFYRTDGHSAIVSLTVEDIYRFSDLSGKPQHHPDGRWAEADLHLYRLRCAMLNFFHRFAFFEAGAFSASSWRL